MSKIILITGAAKGIGRGIVEELIEDKNNIIIANYNKSQIQAEELKKQYEERLDIFKADVSNREEVKRMIKYIIDKYGKIDVLINNAGISNEKLFQDITDEEWKSVINTNLYSVFCLCQEVFPSMLNRKSGCIINISSIYGTNGGSYAVAYSASKAGVDGLTKALAKELGPSGIRVNSIAPGCIDTDMNNYLSSEDIEEIKNLLQIKRIGKPIDIGRCIRWLIEDEYTTGQIIKIDGGWNI